VGTAAQPAGEEVGREFVVLRVLGVQLGGWRHAVERALAAGEQPGAGSVGEEAVVADADEALREDVEEEAADELRQRKGEGSHSPAAVVLVAEGHRLVIDVQESMVGEGDAVGVAGEVLEDVLGAVEGRGVLHVSACGERVHVVVTLATAE
jgi:hypothetical protein